MHEKPAEAVRAKPRSSLVAANVAVGEGRAGRRRLRREHGCDAGRGSPAPTAPAGRAATRHRRPDPDPEGAVRPPRLGRERRCAPRAPAPVRLHGLDLRRGDPRDRTARDPAALDRGRAGEGQPAHAQAHALLEASDLDFAGNAESRDLLAGAADVVVCDGFTGNVALKLLEGTIKTVLDGLRAEITATARGKLGGLLIRPAAGRLRTRLDPDTYGGAYLLGLRGSVGDRARELVARGRSRMRSASPPGASSTTSWGDWPRACPSGVRRRLYDRRALAPTIKESSWQRRVKKSSSGSRKC